MRVIGLAHSLLHRRGIVRIQTDIRVGSRYLPLFISFFSLPDLPYRFSDSALRPNREGHVLDIIDDDDDDDEYIGPIKSRLHKIRFKRWNGSWTNRTAP